VGVLRDKCLSTSGRSRLWAKQRTSRGRSVLARGVTELIFSMIQEVGTHVTGDSVATAWYRAPLSRNVKRRLWNKTLGWIRGQPPGIDSLARMS